MKKKVLIGIAVALVVGFAVWYFFFKTEQDSTIDVTDPTAKSGFKSKLPVWLTGGSRDYKPEPTVFDNDHPIEHGMAGPKTLQLQKYLNKNAGAKIDEDGKWWDATQKAFLAAKFPIPDQAGRIYSVLTKSLYDKLELSKY